MDRVAAGGVRRGSDLAARSKTWLAEIERLRNAGDTARADAELAEYKRQQRAYAVRARPLKPGCSVGVSC